jgi:hypothetical protein
MKTILRRRAELLALLLAAPCAFGADGVPAPWKQLPLTDARAQGSIRDGAGMDLNMGPQGGLHLNLYSHRAPKGPGRRWDMNPIEASLAAPGRFWSLGGTLQVARGRDGERQLALVPQLLLNFDVLGEGAYPLQASIEYAEARSTSGAQAAIGPVPQITLRLRY